MTRELQPCGTSAGYARHWKAGEQPCEPCAQARREYNASRYTPHPRELAPCGTFAAYLRHRSHGEKACADCLEAVKAHNASRKAPPRDPAKCSTTAGYLAHMRHKEAACDPCREAHGDYQRAYRIRKRAERDEFRRLIAEIWAETAS